MVTMAKFSVASPAAGFLMLPYLGWTCFATTLINCSLWDSNPEVVQSAHDVAQVKPQVKPQPDAVKLAPAKSVGHKRNNTWSAGLGQIAQPGSPQTAGQGIMYSSRPIFPRSGSQEHLASAANKQNNQPSFQHGQSSFHNGQPSFQNGQPSFHDSQSSFQGSDPQPHLQNNAQQQQQQQPAQQQPSRQQPDRRFLLQQTSWSHSPSWEHSADKQQQQEQQQQQQSGTRSPFEEAPQGQAEMFAERRATRRTTDDQLAPDRFGQLSDSGHLVMPGQEKSERLQSANSSGLFAKVCCIADQSRT